MVKICPICRATFDTKAALAAHMASAHPVAAQTRRRRGAVTRQSGSITVSNNEYLGSVKSKSLPLWPGKSGAARLDAHAAIYELFRLDRCTLTLKSTSGNSTSGSVFAGVSYDSANPPTDKAKIAALTPSTSAPVTRDVVLPIPTRPMMGAAWLPTASSASVTEAHCPGWVTFVSDQNYDVWLSYTVTFTGTVASRSTGFLAGYDYKTAKWSDVDNQPAQLPAMDAANVELEIGTSSDSVVDQVIGQLRGHWRDAVEIHRMVRGAVSFVHFVVSALVPATLPVLVATVPVIYHAHEQPFRIRALRGRIGLPCLAEVGGTTSC